jgi:hypothetical protein
MLPVVFLITIYQVADELQKSYFFYRRIKLLKHLLKGKVISVHRKHEIIEQSGI